MRPKLSKYDLGLIKAALRRALSRSDLAKVVENRFKVEYTSDKNPRCKKWSRCASCHEITPTWKTQKDHLDPVVPITVKLEDMDPHGCLTGYGAVYRQLSKYYVNPATS